jgi:hypothetical protein
MAAATTEADSSSEPEDEDVDTCVVRAASTAAAMAAATASLTMLRLRLARLCAVGSVMSEADGAAETATDSLGTSMVALAGNTTAAEVAAGAGAAVAAAVPVTFTVRAAEAEAEADGDVNDWGEVGGYRNEKQRRRRCVALFWRRAA